MSNETGRVGAIPPPPGITPDFDNPRDAGYSANIAGTAACTALITVFAAVRFYIKGRIVRQFVLEDWTCLLAWIGQILYQWTVFMMAQHGLGYHAWEITKAEYSELLRWLYASSIVYIPACYFTKITLLLLIARVFAVQEQVSKGIHIFMVLLGLAYLPVQIIKTIICLPIRAYWDPTVENPHCLNQRKVFLADLSLAVLTDGVILVLPVVLTWSLRMPLVKKLKIISLLGIGGGAMAVTIFRTYRVVIFIDALDTSADFVVLDLTTTIEMAIGMICACFPAVNMLIERYALPRKKLPRNIPRTQSSMSKAWQSKWDSLMTWTLKGEDTTILPIHTKTSDHPADFDVQLAMLTGRPVEEIIHIGPNMQPIQSSEGWREGWLAPRGSSSSSGGVIDTTLNGGLIVPGRVWDGTTQDELRRDEQKEGEDTEGD